MSLDNTDETGWSSVKSTRRRQLPGGGESKDEVKVFVAVPRNVKRIVKDLKEILACSPQDIAAAPVSDEDITIWHANIRGWNKAVFHFTLEFPADFPAKPPRVDLCTTIPHVNVFPGKYGKKNHICLDMLEDGEFKQHKSGVTTGWTSSYSVLTVLLQLQSFLLSDELAGRSPRLDAAVRAASEFKCEDCPHRGSKTWPAFTSPEALQPVKLAVSRPVLPRRFTKRPAEQKRAAVTKLKPLLSQPTPVSVEPKKAESKSVPLSVAPDKPKPAEAAPVKQQPAEEQWHEVSYRRGKKRQQEAKQATVVAKPQEDTSALMRQLYARVSQPKKEESEEEEESEPELSEADKLAKAAFLKTKTSKRHAQRARRRAQKRESALKTQAGPAASSASNTPAILPSLTTQKKEEKAGVTVQVVESTVTAVAPVAEEKTAVVRLVGLDSTEFIKAKNGRLGILPYKVLMTKVFSFLPIPDVARMACVSVNMREAAEEGHLWRNFFAQKYSASTLTPANMKDWKYCFLLELNNIVGDMRCFHTKNSFTDDVLGIPLEYTVNPRTQKIDYIASTLDLISSEAYYVDKLRTTMLKEKFTHWLPLYLTEDHFQRGLPWIRKTILNLSPGRGVSTFAPEMALNVLTKIMSTMSVLICDKGIAASERACDGFALLHRLLIAMIQTYPGLQKTVESRIASFLKDEEGRHKDNVPALGEFLPLLSVSEQYTWQSVASAYITESLDRNVLWICKKYPQLADTTEVKADAKSEVKVTTEGNGQVKEESKDEGVDWNRLNKSLEAAAVSTRLLMYNVAFIESFCAGNNDDRANRYDAFYGRPNAQSKSDFLKRVKAILAVKTWPEFFDQVHVKAPTPQKMTSILIKAIKNSERRGYHQKGMDFTRVHKSGVSKILLKGESYSAPPNLAKVTFQDAWRWNTLGLPQYLDASVLFYSRDNAYLGMVDYANNKFGQDSVVHSGDIMDWDKLSGNHSVQIDLKSLPAEVHACYFVLSGYTCDLKSILQPYIRFYDPVSEVNLCTYNLEEKNTFTNTAVVMCCLSRNTLQKNWEVRALGSLCMGRASNYSPIRSHIENKIMKE